jgi:Ca2+-binding EF-hand superfamily protein
LFDLDGNGRISPSEVKEILGMDSHMDDNVLNELLKEIIKSGNKEITFEQFKDIMKSFQTK